MSQKLIYQVIQHCVAAHRHMKQKWAVGAATVAQKTWEELKQQKTSPSLHIQNPRSVPYMAWILLQTDRVHSIFWVSLDSTTELWTREEFYSFSFLLLNFIFISLCVFFFLFTIQISYLSFCFLLFTFFLFFTNYLLNFTFSHK